MNWYDPTDWVDLIDHAWYGLVLIMVAALPSYLAAKNHSAIKKVGEKTDAVVGQVVNGHADQPPLRADIDRANMAIEAIANEVRGLRSDLAAEEDRRRKQIAELRDDIDRRIPDRRGH